MAESNWKKDGSGNIIDPPILGDHERRIIEAQAAGDDVMVHAHQQRYHAERENIVGEIDTAEPDDPPADDLAGDTDDADALARANSYQTLRNAARARGLDTTGGKIDLANRLAGNEDTADDTRTDDDDC